MAARLSHISARLDPGLSRSAPATAESPATFDVETVRLIHKEVKDRAARLDTNSSRLDAKATSLLGFVSAVSLFLATQRTDGWLKILAYAFLALAAYFGFQAMRVRKYSDAPEPRPLVDLVSSRNEAAALALLTEAQVRAYVDNRVNHERKALNWRWSLISLAAAVVATVVALTVGAVHDGKARPGPNPSATAAGTTGPDGSFG